MGCGEHLGFPGIDRLHRGSTYSDLLRSSPLAEAERSYRQWGHTGLAPREVKVGDDGGMIALPTWLAPEMGSGAFERKRLEGRVHMKLSLIHI